MKAKLTAALKSNVDPIFFTLVCAMLFSLTVTVKTLADDVFEAIAHTPGATIMLTTDGQLTMRAD